MFSMYQNYSFEGNVCNQKIKPTEHPQKSWIYNILCMVWMDDNCELNGEGAFHLFSVL